MWDERGVTYNDLQWDGRTRGHHESYTVHVIDPANQVGWFFRYALRAPTAGPPESALWAGHASGKDPSDRFALKTDFEARAFAHLSDGFHIRISKGELTLDSTKGGLRNPKHAEQSIRWNLGFRDRRDPVRTFPKTSFYRRAWPPTKVVTPIPLARASGVVEVGDKRYHVADARVQQVHTWGARLPELWSSAFATGFREDPGAQVHAVAATPQLGHKAYTFVHLQDGAGNEYRFQRTRSRKAPAAHEPGVWTFEASKGRYTLAGRVSSSLQRIVGVSYHDVDGAARFGHHSGVADATLELWKRSLGKRQLQRTLTAKGTVSFEQGGQRAFHDVSFFV